MQPMDHICQFAHHVLAWQETQRLFDEAVKAVPAAQVDRKHRMEELSLVLSAISSGYLAALTVALDTHASPAGVSNE